MRQPEPQCRSWHSCRPPHVKVQRPVAAGATLPAGATLREAADNMFGGSHHSSAPAHRSNGVVEEAAGTGEVRRFSCGRRIRTGARS